MSQSQVPCRRTVVLCAVACLSLLLGPVAMDAQVVAGVISGSVVDISGAVVPGAAITLVNEETADKRVLKSEADGSFVITEVFPGRYTLHIEAQGFKRLDKQNINITASERAALGQIVLAVGSASESVTIEAQGDLVQTTSEERSAVLTTKQMAELQNQGRLAIESLRVLPGIPDPGSGGGLPTINGLPAAYGSMTTDGTPNTELGTTGFSSTRATIDSIEEIKVLSSNYQAEYGTFGGAAIQIVTKSGTSRFHGAGYIYKEHEEFDAASFFNNRNSLPKAKDRNVRYGYSIGGPIYIPGKFNAGKTKLFFFLNQELTRQPSMPGTAQFTVPTDLERAGNFSQTLNVSGQLVTIKDPTTGTSFPGNIIPASRINANGQKLFSIFPEPNITNRAITGGNYNYQIAHNDGRNNRNQETWRGDYNASSNIRLYLRGIHELNQEFNWLYQYTTPRINGFNYIPKNDVGVNSTQIISPTVVNEFLFGFHHRTEYRSVASAANPTQLFDTSALTPYTRSALGVNLPQLYNNNPFNVLPQLSFSDVPQAMGLTWSAGGYFPPTTSELVMVASDSLTKVLGKHTLKAGVSFNHLLRMVTGTGSAAGTFAFGRDTNNPNDSNYGYSNALLGNFTNYTESTSVPLTRDRAAVAEWFVQDSWKASKRLTIDYGARFSWFTPWAEGAGNASNFLPSLWSAKNAPVLFVPTIGPNNQRLALNPLTNTTAPATEIGALVPGSGDPANGLAVQSNPAYPPGFLNRQGILLGPRLGLAYDLFGDGKTALRTGAGVSHNVESSNVETVFVQNPPVQYTPTIYYGSLDNYFNTSGVLFPSNAKGYQLSGKAPTVYSYSFGIQRSIGFGTIVDVAYVGNLTRHQTVSQNINLLPPGTRFLPGSADPTKPGSPLPDAFLAPYRGFGSITEYDRAGNANYNSLQAQVNRRFARGVQFGVSWTYSKAMTESATLPTYYPVHLLAYGRAGFDVRQILITNFLYDIPAGSRLWNSFLTRAVTDHWHLSGISTLQTGTPLNVTFTTTNGADLTGGGDTQRIDVISSPYLPKGSRTFAEQFNPAAFALPAKGTIGTLGPGLLSNPGFINFDFAAWKDVPLMSERLRFQIRFEAFNAFNHTEYSAVNSAAQFNPAGVQSNSQFGQVTATRNPRQCQAALRVTF